MHSRISIKDFLHMQKNTMLAIQPGWNLLMEMITLILMSPIIRSILTPIQRSMVFHRYDILFIDSHKQCQKAKQIFDPKQIDLILVSPQRRALQTCREIFNQNKNSKVIVHPLVTQVFRYSCDLSGSTKQKQLEFSEYDFSSMKGYNQDDEWYLDIISQEKRKICIQHFQKLNIHPIQQTKEKPSEYSPQQKRRQRQLAALELLQKNIITQSATQLRQRVNKLKDLIHKLKLQHKANKVAVVSHHYTTQCLLAPDFHQDDSVKGIGIIINAKPYFRKLEDILKVK